MQNPGIARIFVIAKAIRACARVRLPYIPNKSVALDAAKFNAQAKYSWSLN